MSEQVCLRCDWIGQDDLATCPRCGAPLFRSRGSEEPSEGGSADEPATPFVAPAATGRRWVAVVLGLAIAAAGTTFVLVSRPSGPAAAPASPTPDAVASPTLSERASPSASPSRDGMSPCSGMADRGAGPAQPPGSPPASDALTAEYRFQSTLASSVGDAPPLHPTLDTIARFQVERFAGERRTVLRFWRGSGLELAPTAGETDGQAYTIELLFRFDRLDGYRKIVDFADGSEDCGLYDLDGRLAFYSVSQGGPGRIVAGEYVHVVLTRGASSRVVGYVDGVYQFAFLDSQGIAAVGAYGRLALLRRRRDDRERVLGGGRFLDPACTTGRSMGSRSRTWRASSSEARPARDRRASVSAGIACRFVMRLATPASRGERPRARAAIQPSPAPDQRASTRSPTSAVEP